MIILSAETSTQKGTVALTKDGKSVAEKTNEIQKSHSEALHRLIEELLKENDLSLKDVDIFATSLGPGSFTGLRIAGNSMKAFSFALRKPMVAVDSLTLLADAFPEDGKIIPWINAYKNMVYWASFEKKNGKLTQIHAPSVIRVQDLEKIMTEPTWVLGDGYKVYKDFLSETVSKNIKRPDSEVFDFPRASTLGQIANSLVNSGQTIVWNSFQPLYIRASEAEENKSGVLYSSLN